ncbi:hypothetical protein [Nocardia brasiliensis]|uniref:hypothetical protein n=1 Tax=Nocardia brasiliensis TaxID=37326 RepID=UPI0024580845|nr:hypothetical protein [Nocardia brasiliensis]
MSRRMSVLAAAAAVATVACLGPAVAAPTTATAPPNKVDVTGAERAGGDVLVSVTYLCEPVDAPVTLQVFIRRAEGEQTLGAKSAATCDGTPQTQRATATKVADAEPFTPESDQSVRVFASLFNGDKALEGGTALKRLTLK